MKTNHRTASPDAVCRRTPFAAAALFAAFSAGCGSPLDRPLPEGDPVPCPDVLAGDWSGTITGHQGVSRPVRATYAPQPDGAYLATYNTSVGLVVPVCCRTTHVVVRDAETAKFCGRAACDGLPGFRYAGVSDGRVLRVHLASGDESFILRLRRAD